MPVSTKKSITRKSKRSSTKKSPRKSSKSNNNSRSSVISKTMTFTSNPSKGEPYGTFEEVVMKNGKGTRVTGKLNKSGKQIEKKKTNISAPKSTCMAVNVTPLNPDVLFVFLCLLAQFWLCVDSLKFSMLLFKEFLSMWSIYFGIYP